MLYLAPTKLENDIHGFKTNIYFVSVPHGTLVDDLLQPPYWMHHSAQLLRWDSVRCIAEDGSFDVSLVVHDVVRGAVKMHLDRISFVNKEAQTALANERAEEAKKPKPGFPDPNKVPCVKFAGPKKWRLIGYDNKIVEEGIQTEIEAKAKLNLYLERTKAA